MSENIKYMVVITGKSMPGHNIANVRNNVALRFNMQDARVDKLFSGRPVAVKRNMTLEAAKKFKEVFAQLGARMPDHGGEKRPESSERLSQKPKRRSARKISRAAQEGNFRRQGGQAI